jgi:GAF domain-containing protein
MPDTNLTGRLSDILALSLNRAAKAKLIAEAIRDNGAYRWVGLYDVDHAHGLVSNIAWSGPSGPAYPTFPISKGLTSRAIAGNKTINIGEVASDPDYLAALGSSRSEIIIPVFDYSGVVIGTIDVESERPDAFGPLAQASLESIVSQLVAFYLMRD